MKLLRIITVVAAVSLMITVHEFGHWSVARMCGIKCPTFAIGMGPREYSLVIGTFAQTEFRIAPLPIGGFCEIPELEESIWHPESGVVVPLWKQCAIGLAGIVYGLMFAAAALVLAFRLNPEPLEEAAGQKATPIVALAAGISGAAVMTWATALGVLSLFFPFAPRGCEKSSDDQGEQENHVVGPIGTIRSGMDSLLDGWYHFLFWFAAVNVGLAIANLLPVVPLDGGQVFVGIAQRALGLTAETCKSLGEWTLYVAVALFCMTRRARQRATA